MFTFTDKTKHSVGFVTYADVLNSNPSPPPPNQPHVVAPAGLSDAPLYPKRMPT